MFSNNIDREKTSRKIKKRLWHVHIVQEACLRVQVHMEQDNGIIGISHTLERLWTNDDQISTQSEAKSQKHQYRQLYLLFMAMQQQ